VCLRDDGPLSFGDLEEPSRACCRGRWLQRRGGVT